MTRTVSKDEFRADIDELLLEVRAGGLVSVVEDGMLIASLVPSKVFVEAAPTVHRARVRGGFNEIPRSSAASSESMQETLDYLRGDK